MWGDRIGKLTKAQLIEQIRNTDHTDPFALADLIGLQRQLYALTEETGSSARPGKPRKQNKGSQGSPVPKGSVTVGDIRQAKMTQPGRPKSKPARPAGARTNRTHGGRPPIIDPPQLGSAERTAESKPLESSMARGKVKWRPTIDWCVKRLSDRSLTKTARQELEILLALVQRVDDASTHEEFRVAQKMAVGYRALSPVLSGMRPAVPIPAPLPVLDKRVLAPQPARPGGHMGRVQGRDRRDEAISAISLAGARGTGATGAQFPRGESLALYQRGPATGRGMSFEDSVGVRQLGKQARRHVVDVRDRVIASGSQEDYEDLDG